ncbi:PEP-CTERM sorting domain-containing protein [Nitrosomonas sp.]|uniref:PEP-CTERM sorting domain-containing protein n=1 Tax=Nitrosomonas sp. TaxID=42353 RepID=UPI0025F15E7B|nr:PEP-CTERM sorting domain-containing protein [Nitrosomonas sp.]
MKKIICYLFLCMSVYSVNATAATVSTGDLGNNVITGGGLYEISMGFLGTPSNSLPSHLDVKYGLWNSPDVDVSVFFNDINVGHFIADQGYISPGPEFISFDITGLFIDGLNKISFNGFGIGGDYVIGQIDVTYAIAPVPEPETYAMLLAGLCFVGFFVHRRKESAV